MTSCDLTVLRRQGEKLDILAARGITTRVGFDGIYPLLEALSAVEHASRRGTLKILVRTGRN